MGNVYQFKRQDEDQPSTPVPANMNTSAEIVVLHPHQGVMPKATNQMRDQIEALLAQHGVDTSSELVRMNLNLMSIISRSMVQPNNPGTSRQVAILQSVQMAFADYLKVPDDTDEVFGDLLSKLNEF